MIVDCESCPVRGVHCDGCMVAALYAVEPSRSAPLELDAAERAAVAVLLDAGLVHPEVAQSLQARREPWPFRAVG